MSFVDPEALSAIRGAALFYPGAGRDLEEPLRMFVPTIVEYWFVDVAYFTSRESADDRNGSILGHDELMFEGFELVGPPFASREVRVDDATGYSYSFIRPCTRTELYRHRTTDSRVIVHRRRGFGQRSIALVSDIGVFFHRGDSIGESGSNVHWLSNRWIREVMSRLRDGGLVVTDGSLAHAHRLRRFHGTDTPSEKAFAQAMPFTKWGRRWTYVGWASSRYGPTLVWRTNAA